MNYFNRTKELLNKFLNKYDTNKTSKWNIKSYQWEESINPLLIMKISYRKRIPSTRNFEYCTKLLSELENSLITKIRSKIKWEGIKQINLSINKVPYFLISDDKLHPQYFHDIIKKKTKTIYKRELVHSHDRVEELLLETFLDKVKNGLSIQIEIVKNNKNDDKTNDEYN